MGLSFLSTLYGIYHYEKKPMYCVWQKVCVTKHVTKVAQKHMFKVCAESSVPVLCV